MRVTDVWHAALVRLGADSKSARQMIAAISCCASSQAEFDAWDSRLPDPAGRALIKGIQGPDGTKLSQELLGKFRTRMMEHFGISEEEIQQILSGIGRN